MVNPNKASPSDKFQLFGVLVSIVPVMGTAVLVAWGGYYLGQWISSGAWPYLTIISWGLLIGIFIFEKDPKWIFFLLVGFSFIGGMLLQGLGLDVNHSRGWGSLVLGFVIAFIWGASSGSQLAKAGGVLFPLTILYLLGWIVFSFYSFPSEVIAVWAGLGWLLFTLIGTSVISRRSSGMERIEPISLASDLFVVFFNLFWLATVFWSAV